MSFKSPYRMLQGWRRPREAAMGFLPQAYFQRVLATGPIAYWIQGEAAGLVSIDQVDSPAQDGAYTGVTLGQPGIGDENTSPFFDGVNDFNNVLTAALTAAFNGGEGTIMEWARVFNVGVWAGARRRFFWFNGAGTRLVHVTKTAAAGQMEYAHRNGGAANTVILNGVATVDWFPLAITWSASAPPTGEMRAYFNGAQVGATQVNLVAWGGALTNAVIGATNVVPTEPWHGYLAHAIVWDRPLLPAELADLAVL